MLYNDAYGRTTYAGGKNGGIKTLPVGYANWPGMCILANPKYKATFGEVHEVAARFVAAFETLYSELTAHTNNSIFMDPAAAPNWMKARDGRSTLFSNLVYVSHGPMWIRIPVDNGTGTNLVKLPEGCNGQWRTNTESHNNFAYDAVEAKVGTYNKRLGELFKSVVNAGILNLMSKKTSSEDYDTEIAEITGTIRKTILDNDELISQFASFFDRMTLRTGRFVLNNRRECSVGIYLARTVVELAQLLVKEGDDFGAAAFINMATNNLTVKALVTLLDCANTIITQPDVPKWENTKAPTESLKSKLHAAIKDKSNGASLKEIPEYSEADDADNGLLGNDKKVYLPRESARYMQDEYIIHTRLTGGAALFRATIKYMQGTQSGDVTNMLTRYVVAVDPYAEPEHLSHLGNPPGVPPIVAEHYNTNGKTRHFGAPGDGVGQKRSRFGALENTRENRQRLDEDAAYASEYVEEPFDHGPWNTAMDKSPFKASDSFRERFHDVSSSETDLLRRVAKLAFLGQPVTLNTFTRIVASDDVFPFGFLLLRPYMTYAMASAILTVAGSRTGETLVGHADFQLGDNIVQKMHIGNFTMYLKSIVYQPQHVWIAENVMACGYIGGNNCDFRKSDQLSDPPALPSDPSLIACLIPYDCAQSSQVEQVWESEIPNPLDITGDYAAGNPALAALRNTVKKLHYASALFYRSRFGWDNADQNMSDDSIGTSNRYNTLTFAGHYAMYNPVTQRYDLVHENTGHRGNRIYQGCGRVWRGLAKLLEPVNYVSQHGGAPIRSLVTNAV